MPASDILRNPVKEKLTRGEVVASTGTDLPFSSVPPPRRERNRSRRSTC